MIQIFTEAPRTSLRADFLGQLRAGYAGPGSGGWPVKETGACLEEGMCVPHVRAPFRLLLLRRRSDRFLSAT